MLHARPGSAGRRGAAALALAALASTALALTPFAGPAQAATTADAVVISEVYGGGGNSGATWNRDYVELYNPTDTVEPGRHVGAVPLGGRHRRPDRGDRADRVDRGRRATTWSPRPAATSPSATRCRPPA